VKFRIAVGLLLATLVFVACTHTATKPAVSTQRCSTIPDSMVHLDGEIVDFAKVKELDVDSIFNMIFLSDSTQLSAYGLCPGKPALAWITTAYARRHGLRPPPPALCIRYVDGALPVGERIRLSAGQLDILDECDRSAPAGLTWRSANPDVASVDSTGEVTAKAPGKTEVIVTASGADARHAIEVIPVVQRFEIVADTVLFMGDTIEVQARAYGIDGRPMPDVPLIVNAHTDLVRDGELRHGPWRKILIPGQANRWRMSPHYAGRAWIRAGVIGKSDSLAVRVRE
jgi:hypothetical protein